MTVASRNLRKKCDLPFFPQKLTTELTLYTLITTAVPLNFAQKSWLNGSLDLP